MISHEHFVAAIRESPDDPLMRMVYADWLEEKADPRAELQRMVAQGALWMIGGSYEWEANPLDTLTLTDSSDAPMLLRYQDHLATVQPSATFHQFAMWCANLAMDHEREFGEVPDPTLYELLEAKQMWLEDRILDLNLQNAIHQTRQHRRGSDALRLACRAASDPLGRKAAGGAESGTRLVLTSQITSQAKKKRRWNEIKQWQTLELIERLLLLETWSIRITTDENTTAS